MTKFYGIIFLIFCFSASCANAWGIEGHKIVAQVAWNLLNSNAQQGIISFISTSYTLPDIAPLPDDYDHTPQGRWSAPCHYVNLPRNATSIDMNTDCPDFCVVKSIQNYTNILQGEQPFQCDFQQGEEPCALEFLTHFVGDVHQPLHVSFAYDEGGNKVPVSFFGTKTNLHAVWDDYIIQKWNDDFSSASQELQEIITNNSSLIQQYTANMDPLEWATESFDYVLSTVYNFTGSQKPGKTIYLGDDYYNRNLPIVQQRLMAAGIRLAAVFDNIFQMLEDVKFNY